MPSSTYLPISCFFLIATFLKIIMPILCLHLFTSHSSLGTLVPTVMAHINSTQHLHLAKFIDPFLVIILLGFSAGFESADTLSLLSPFSAQLLVKCCLPPTSLAAPFQCPLPRSPHHPYKWSSASGCRSYLSSLFTLTPKVMLSVPWA